MAIRPAHTVSIIQKRLKQAEMSDTVDAMELVGIYDELSRVERKWLEKAEQFKAGRPATRPLSDASQMNERFDRLSRIISASLRRGIADPAERQLVERCADALGARLPLANLR